MTFLELPPEEDERSRPRRVWDAFYALASTEMGGWVLVGMLIAACLAAIAILLIIPRSSLNGPAPTPPVGALHTLPAAEAAEFTVAPDALEDISFDEARAKNAALPYSTEPNPPAKPFIAPVADVGSYGRALDCLTAAIYYEAGNETSGGKAAVAQVVLNRVRHPAYPRTVCGVVFQGSERATGCQFTFTCDGALARPPSLASWAASRAVALAALNGTVFSPVGTATHYHTDWVAPYWAPKLAKITKIGTHIFYRWAGTWGRRPAFSGLYTGDEPAIPKMASLASFTLLEEPVLSIEVVETGPVSNSPLASPEIVVSQLPISLPPALPPIAVAPTAPIPTAAQQSAIRDAQRDTQIMADPQINPAQPARPRRRTAAPSTW